eukprot:m.118574 g.118574  ORF g.118574 m.118574 type:complete len:123 (-) comp15452_c0_seq4:1389-1757(-)
MIHLFTACLLWTLLLLPATDAFVHCSAPVDLVARCGDLSFDLLNMRNGTSTTFVGTDTFTELHKKFFSFFLNEIVPDIHGSSFAWSRSRSSCSSNWLVLPLFRACHRCSSNPTRQQWLLLSG